MQIITPDTLSHIGKKIILIGLAAVAVGAEVAGGNAVALRSARESLTASEADYDKAMSELAPEQREWVENLFADALAKARAGRDGYPQAVYMAQIKWADDQVRELETVTTKLKDARTDWVRDAMSLSLIHI